MKKVQHQLIALLFSILAFAPLGFAQNAISYGLKFEVNKVLPYISITEKKLAEAQSLTDLDKRYPSSWIKEYISVEVSASHHGAITKALGKNGTLSQEQKDLIRLADMGTDIVVRVQYIPENTLTNNDIHLHDFTIAVVPENDAEYTGGQQQMIQYLKENAIDKIPDDSFKGFDLAAIKFTVTEEGQIIDVQVAVSSKDKSIDELLLATSSNMPNWKPAEYSNGLKVKQEFVLTVGNMENCMVNLLNIR